MKSLLNADKRIAVWALVLGLGLSLPGCGKSSANAPSAGPAAMPVQVRIATSAKIPETTEYLSILKSRHSAVINPQVEGQVTKILVKSGDRVTTGTPLLQIDPLKQEATVGGQEASRMAQEANVRYAGISLDRAKKLHDAGVISKQDLDNAQTGYDAAVAQLKALDEQVNQQKVELRYYRVSAPMDGIVGDIPVRVGDRVTVATLLTTVDEPGPLEAYVYVPAEKARNLKIGLPVRLSDGAGNLVSDTEVTFVSPQVDTDTQTVLVKAAVQKPKSKVRIAQQVRGQITWGVREGPVIPVLAVQRINGEFFAFVAVNEGKGPVARQRVVKLGDTVGNDFAVLDGLQPGDHIIVSGTQFLQDGMPVSEQIQNDGKSPTGK
ncbi:MAG TPA: efflux RND transporter periplasmic adaptor subunit [Candidatus Sulfotelmatobacter sp.]|nr:efflux RND transporter periplasmic adaptor subunit [Candidatus Sulfotelmatobacter sp.]